MFLFREVCDALAFGVLDPVPLDGWFPIVACVLIGIVGCEVICYLKIAGEHEKSLQRVSLKTCRLFIPVIRTVMDICSGRSEVLGDIGPREADETIRYLL